MDIVLRKLENLPEKYKGMVQSIADTLPAAQRTAENFFKSASQFKTVTLDNTALTPIRSIKQILAEVDHTVQALQEAHINLRKADIELRRKKAAAPPADPFAAELLEVETQDLQWQQERAHNYMMGAVRKLAFQLTQYSSVLKMLGKEDITEEDYERDEVRYHIMTAFKQALCAARARGGGIDEGNHIYLFDLGINGHAAQREVTDYLKLEAEANRYTYHAETIAWLRALADKYKTCPVDAAKARGLRPLDLLSLASGRTPLGLVASSGSSD